MDGWTANKSADCDYSKNDSRQQFIHGLDNNGMIGQILRKVSTPDDIDDASSKLVLLWPKGYKPESTKGGTR